MREAAARGRHAWRVALCASLLGGALLAARASAQCAGDATPRVLWAYPPQSTFVGPYVPVLLRLVGTPNGVPTFTAGGSGTERAFSLLPGLAPPDLALAAPLPPDTSIRVRVPLGSGATLEHVFGTQGTDLVPPNETLALMVLRHFVGTDVGGLSEACRAIVFAPSAERCWADAGTVSIGFDLRLDAVMADGSHVVPSSVARAYEVIPETALPGMFSLPRLWPAECGTPRAFATEPLDRSDVCFRIAALVDAVSDSAKVIESQRYCLGSGVAWPASDAGAGDPDLDAGAPSLPKTPPGNGLPPGGFCGCNCPPGVTTACDYIDAGAGKGGAAGGAARGRAAGAGAGGGAAGGSGQALQTASAGGNAAAHAHRGCGCRIAARASHREPGVLGLFLWLAIGARRLGARRGQCRPGN